MDQQKDRHTDWPDDLSTEALYGQLPPGLREHTVLALAMAHLQIAVALIGEMDESILDRLPWSR